MALFSLDELKKKAQTLWTESTEIAKDLGQQAVDYLEEKIPEVTEIVTDFVKENTPIVEEFIAETTEKVKQTINDINETNKKRKTMNHKIIMLGGRRAGKSTILASILQVLKKEMPGSICTVNDSTDYTQTVTDKDGHTYPLPTLDSKRLEVNNFIKTHKQNETFLVDMAPTTVKGSYILTVHSGEASVDLEFVDVPGEWMRRNVAEHNELKEHVMSSDVFVIAIDTPYLMHDDSDVNEVYNRVNEITDALSKIQVDQNVVIDSKLIILCPVKCEKWIKAGEANLVTQKVKNVYRNLINQWVKYPNVNIWIMPIQTVGGLESVKLTPAKRYKNDLYDKHEQWKSCMVDEKTGQVFDVNGKCIRGDIEVEDDERMVMDFTPIPLSWYRKNGLEFSPVNCEQPGFHILRFLVNKEEDVIKEKARQEREKLDRRNPIWQWLTKIFSPTFGEYLPVWSDAIKELEKRELIKEQGDGFEHVKQVVE